MDIETTRPAALVASIRAPWRATVAECLARWRDLDGDARARSYLVLEGEVPGRRHTLDGRAIERLAAQSDAGGAFAIGDGVGVS